MDREGDESPDSLRSPSPEVDVVNVTDSPPGPSGPNRFAAARHEPYRRSPARRSGPLIEAELFAALLAARGSSPMMSHRPPEPTTPTRSPPPHPEAAPLSSSPDTPPSAHPLAASPVPPTPLASPSPPGWGTPRPSPPFSSPSRSPSPASWRGHGPASQNPSPGPAPQPSPEQERDLHIRAITARIFAALANLENLPNVGLEPFTPAVRAGHLVVTAAWMAKLTDPTPRALNQAADTFLTEARVVLENRIYRSLIREIAALAVLQLPLPPGDAAQPQPEPQPGPQPAPLSPSPSSSASAGLPPSPSSPPEE